MNEFIMMKGLPASGKSTYSKKYAVDENAKRVCKDDLRAMMDSSVWSKDNENFVLRIRNGIIHEAMSDGSDVIVDDTNLHPKHEKEFREMVKQFNDNKGPKQNPYEFIVVDFTDVSVAECIKRDSLRPNSVGAKVITDMHKQFLAKEFVPREQDPTKEPAIIVDIDGTVAQMNGRSPYDHTQYHTDVPIDTIVDLVTLYRDKGYKIIFLTGRDEVARSITDQWIKKHIFPTAEYQLLMRPNDDKRQDTIVKKELFEKHVDGKFNVQFALEDRLRNCKMFRDELGIKVLHVDEGAF